MSNKESLKQQIQLNNEMISNLKEFFGSYLSNFLKEYRNNAESNNDCDDVRMKNIIKSQDAIFDKFHNLMKDKKSITISPEQSADLKNYLKYQQQVIVIIKKFFSSNSAFIRLYRERPSKNYNEMENLIGEQESIFSELSDLIKRHQ